MPPLWSIVRQRRLGTAMVLAALALAVLTVIAGTPRPLPDVALGSVILLHLERVGLGLALAALVATIVQRSWAGDLPIKLGSAGVEYAAAVERVGDGSFDVMRDVTDRFDGAIERLETTVGRLVGELADERRHREDLERRLALVEGGE